jgi:hypothetical protein
MLMSATNSPSSTASCLMAASAAQIEGYFREMSLPLRE